MVSWLWHNKKYARGSNYFFVLLLFFLVYVDILFPCFSIAPNASSYTNVVQVTMLKSSTNNILQKDIENKLNIQSCPYPGHGRCSRHEVDVHLRRDIQIKDELLLTSHMIWNWGQSVCCFKTSLRICCVCLPSAGLMLKFWKYSILRSVATVKTREFKLINVSVGSLVLILRKYSNTNLTIILIPRCSSMIRSIYTPMLNKLKLSSLWEENLKSEWLCCHK